MLDENLVLFPVTCDKMFFYLFIDFLQFFNVLSINSYMYHKYLGHFHSISSHLICTEIIFFLHHNRMATTGRAVSLFKQAMNEIPEVVLSGVAATIFAGIAYAKIRYDYSHGAQNKRYKLQPVLMRPDDPRAVNVHKT